jgi:oxygen-independent coproporphyrinogen-3 oxidase
VSVDLFKKYDVPVPRYTSYPTVPFWTDNPTSEQWVTELAKAFSDEKMTWALYLHLPFCESLCTFCGCNTVITKDHSREEGYIRVIHKEWDSYIKRVPEILKRPLRQLHLGGGTPTFFSPDHLKNMLEPILSRVEVLKGDFDASIEVDPRRTTVEHLKALYDSGFTRVSMGVQDFDAEVQRLVNRIQPFEVTKKLTDEARSMGYTLVNYDLIYGLPKQTLTSFEKTARLTAELRPDRIALYSFALVPWSKKISA